MIGQPSFVDRVDAGRALGRALQRRYGGRDDVIVLALPRGGVPVAYEVARALRAPLDVFVVRKLGLPGHEELAIGAIASGGMQVVNEDVVAHLNVPPETIERVAARERHVLAQRERTLRGDRPEPDVAGRTVVLVDDGLATGSTMRAAIAALRSRAPASIVVAVPVGAENTCREMRRDADDVICVSMPEPFVAVGQDYDDFTQTSDDEVRALLDRAGEPSHP
jgi:putative phosphoribosyl transferase